MEISGDLSLHSSFLWISVPEIIAALIFQNSSICSLNSLISSGLLEISSLHIDIQVASRQETRMMVEFM